MKKEKYTFNDLLEIMERLRGEDGCPWDREQTHESLKKYLIEETYEVLDAIESKNSDDILEELGDVLLQVIFHSQIGKEEGTFTIDDVIDSICNKMISRHVHVFGDTKVDTADEVLEVWEKVKKKEKGNKTQTETMIKIPKGMPALLRSYKVQEKASQVGFDWDSVDGAFDKVEEEIKEFKYEYMLQKSERIRSEMGDILFSLVNVCRFLKIQPELVLAQTTEKFIKRFDYVEKTANKQGRELKEMSLEQMDKLWDEAKIIMGSDDLSD